MTALAYFLSIILFPLFHVSEIISKIVAQSLQESGYRRLLHHLRRCRPECRIDFIDRDYRDVATTRTVARSMRQNAVMNSRRLIRSHSSARRLAKHSMGSQQHRPRQFASCPLLRLSIR
jgi:hypothetical protein